MSDPEAGLIAVRSEENDYRGAEFPEIREEEKKLFKRVVTEGYNLHVNDVSSCTTTSIERSLSSKPHIISVCANRFAGSCTATRQPRTQRRRRARPSRRRRSGGGAEGAKNGKARAKVCVADVL